jgi:hypothetical protein
MPAQTKERQRKLAPDVIKARQFLKRRRPSDGVVELEADEDRRRGKIQGALQALDAELTSDEDAWARCRPGRTEAGGGDAALEEILGYMLFKAGPPGWYVGFDAGGWRTLKRYARAIASRTGNPAWKESGAWVAQLIANACAPRLVAAFERVVKGAQGRLPRDAGPSFEVFIEHRLGGAMDELLQGTDPYVTPSDVVNYFLRDRAFMADLVDRAVEEAPRSTAKRAHVAGAQA